MFKTIAIGCDHAAVEYKDKLRAYLEGQGYTVLNMGTDSTESCDYPIYANKVCDKVVSKEADCGILICGTGIGMALAADKVAGVRAANIINPQFAALCREHNDCNVITLSGRFVDLEANKQILDAFFSTDFGGGRHAGRVEKIMALD